MPSLEITGKKGKTKVVTGVVDKQLKKYTQEQIIQNLTQRVMNLVNTLHQAEEYMSADLGDKQKILKNINQTMSDNDMFMETYVRFGVPTGKYKKPKFQL